MYKNLKIIYQNLGENIALGIKGSDEKELELLLNSFFNFGLVDIADFTEVSDNFRYIITKKERLNNYLFLSCLFQFLNQTGQELDSDNNPNIVQKYFATRMAKARFESFGEENFYPINNNKNDMENRYIVKEPNLTEEEEILEDNLKYETEIA